MLNVGMLSNGVLNVGMLNVGRTEEFGECINFLFESTTTSTMRYHDRGATLSSRAIYA